LVGSGGFLLGRREMGGREWRRVCDQLCEASEVLGDCRQRELVLCATRASQTKSVEPQDALQVREPHLDAFAVVPGLLEGFGPDKDRATSRACS